MRALIDVIPLAVILWIIGAALAACSWIDAHRRDR
jgi:hypothetical protein